MITNINPKLPMRNKSLTRDFYLDKLGFKVLGKVDYLDYLMLERDGSEIHFFNFKELDPNKNFGQVYIRTNDIDSLYHLFLNEGIIHPNGHLEIKYWGQKEFSILDPDSNLLTFGESI